MSPRWSSEKPRTLEDSDVFAAFLCLYLLTASRSPPFGDAIPLWEAACDLVRHGSFAIDTRWPVNAPPGPDGHYYPVSALLAVLVHVPGALLQAMLVNWAPDRAPQFVAVTSQIAPLTLGALVPTLFFRLQKQIGYGRRPAAWTTLMLGAATPIWVYAHRPYSEVLQAVCFTLFLGLLLRAGEVRTRTAWVRLGLSLALLVNAKNVYFACLPGALVYLLWRARSSAREFRATLPWAGLGLAPGLLALGWYNHARWGSVFRSGYGSVTGGFWGEHVLVGLWGQFMSPGKGVFLYAPPLILSLIALGRFWRNRSGVAIAILLVVCPVVVLYARYLFWSGDWGWGPRYLVFALPAMLIPAAEIFRSERASLVRTARRRSLAAASGLTFVLGAGLSVTCAGNAFYWDDFINIARQAQQAWLGRPDTRGTVLSPYPCFSCFEQVYAIDWLPPMQPIAGHFWLLRHKLAGDDWTAAERDAPWRRYTSLRLDIKASYEAAAIDWWPYAADPGRRLPTALVALLLLGAIPLRPWARALRSADPGGEPTEPHPPEPPVT